MAIALDYTQVDISDDGATFGTAIRTQFQNAQADLGNRPEKASNEIISGTWTFTGVPNFTFGFNASGGTIDGQLTMESTLEIDGGSTGRLTFTGTVPVDGAPVFLGKPKMQGGVDLHAPGTSGDVTVAEITMEEIASGNTSANGLNVVKEDGGNKIQFIPVSDGVEMTSERLEFIFSAKAWKFADDATVIMRSLRYATPVPSTSSSAGVPGDIAWDSSYIYQCIAINTWKRAALSTW